MYVYRTYKIYISLSADFKKSFNLLLLQKTEGIAFSSLKRVANVTACRALERWCWGGIKWAWDEVAQASNLPFPSQCSPQSATGKREVKPDLPSAGTGRLSDTVASAHLSGCEGDLTLFLTTFGFVFLTEAGSRQKHRQSKITWLPPHPAARTGHTWLRPAPSCSVRRWCQHRHQITLLGHERTDGRADQAQGTRLSSLQILSSLYELRYATEGWLAWTCSCFFTTQNLQIY